jgi:hypothetical protein
MADHLSLGSTAGTGQDLATTQRAELFAGYRRCLCCFIDVLGFRELVVASRQDEQAKSKLHKILRQFQRNLNHKGVPGDRKSKEPALIVRAFSDSIIRIVPLGDHDRHLTEEEVASEIVHELIDLCGAQFDLLTDGILVRGGLAIGELYWDDHEIFGPALIDAYDLENKMAVHPRIVLDAVVSDYLRKGTAEFVSFNYRRQESDDTWFVDYLGFYSAMLAPNMILNKTGFHKPFEVFRSHIVDNLAKFQSTERVQAKHLWLANYFNGVVAEVPAEFIKKWSHLLVPV